MKHFYHLVLLLFCLLTGFETLAQPEPCLTMQMDSLLRARNPGMGSLDDFERVLQAKIREREELSKNGKVALETLTIPVVVHIVHNGEAVGIGRT